MRLSAPTQSLDRISARGLLIVAAQSVAARDDKAYRFYEDAVARFEKNDTAGAIIQLKNALQENPSMLAAQTLLGRAYLASGQPQAAQESLERAVRLGVHPSEVAAPLAQAMLEQGKDKEVLARFAPESASPDQRADILVLRGRAYKQLNDLQSARRAFEEARTLKPQYFPALQSLVELSIQQGRLSDAIKLSNEGIQLAPSNSKTWFLKGFTSEVAGDAAAAIAEYGRAVELDPADHDARRARASLLLAQNRISEAGADVEQLTRDDLKDTRTLYLRATYFSKKGDEKAAREAMTEITQSARSDQGRRAATQCPLPPADWSASVSAPGRH